MPPTRRQVLVGASGVVALTAGCLGDAADDDQDSSDDSDDDDHADHDDGFLDELGIYEFQLLDRTHDPNEEVSFMHGDHWHGSGDFPTVPEGDNLSIGATAYDEDGNEIELWDGYELRAAVASGAAEDVVSFEFHGDYIHIIGEEEGLTEIVFQVWHDDHADYQSEPLAVQVGETDHGHDDDHDHDHDDEFDAHHVADVSILDRSHDPHEDIADWHDGHWDGELPTVSVGDRISLGATFVDEDGNEAALSSDYELRVRLNDDAPEYVTFDYHGDHVHIIGEGVGETSVIFQLWHDDHAEFETDPITVTASE